MTTFQQDLAIELRDLAVATAIRAGELARYRRGEGVSVAYSKSAITDIVTEADRETERLVRSLITTARPDDGFIGEEFEPMPSKSGISWVVDPIDGTVNFLYGLAPYAVSIAAIEGDPAGKWEPLAAAVINITENRCFSAARGHGAYYDGRRLTVGATTELEVALVATGYSYLPATRAKQNRVIGQLLEEIRDIRRFGCASLDLCAVAAGAVDVYFERGLKPWDYSAGALIAREAGAVVRGWDNDRPGEPLTVAGNPILIDKLYPKIRAAMIAEDLQPIEG